MNLHELERKLRKHFLAFERDVSVGQLDNKKLARFIINIKHDNIFKRQTVRKQNDCCISFLLDNSGSMQGEPIAATITATYFIATILEKLGVKTEILGFTTKNWKGGQSYKDWLKGRSKAPGRVADLRHIIYKKHATNMRCQAKNLALMLKHGFLKENIDGEALQWCYRRIKNYPEQKKIILVISDGAPIEETTIKLNGDSYLENHLQQVIRNIEKDSSVKLVACGINYAIDKFYKNTIMLKNHREFNDVFFDSFLNLIK